MDLLSAIHAEVNASMSYRRDVVDEWRTDCPAEGDCEDHVLCYASKLQERGVSLDRMALSICVDRKGRTHAQLLVDGIALDQQKAAPVTIQEDDCVPQLLCPLNGSGPKAWTKCQGASAALKALPAD